MLFRDFSAECSVNPQPGICLLPGKNLLVELHLDLAELQQIALAEVAYVRFLNASKGCRPRPTVVGCTS